MAMATAAAAATRSRRAERRAKEPAAPSQQQQQPVQQQQQQQQQLARAKRARDFTDHGDRDTVVAKKPRLGIAVEFPTKPLPPPPPPPSRPTTSSVASNSSSSNSSSNSRDGGAAEQIQQQQQRPQGRTKHQTKVANGLKAELSRLQPSSADTAAAVGGVPEQGTGRKLRSQESTRLKSELSNYFPEYDEIIGNDPKEEHLLNLETPIVIVPAANQAPISYDKYPVMSFGDHLFTDLWDSQVIDFSFLNSKVSHNLTEKDDPLPDSLFELPHKRAERQERSIRNTEKGRAKHEKEQVVRLLEGLQGPEWLRILGVHGPTTEAKRRQYEPAREYFISGCQAILDKFKRWTAEEKRRKQMEKDKAAAQQAAAAGSVESPQHDKEKEEKKSQPEKSKKKSARASKSREVDNDEEDQEVPDSEFDSDSDDGSGVYEEPAAFKGKPPDLDDHDDADVEKQLREEALAAAAAKRRTKSAKGKRTATTTSASSSSRCKKTVGPSKRPVSAATAQNKNRSASVPTTAPATGASSAKPKKKTADNNKGDKEASSSKSTKELTSFFTSRAQRDAALARHAFHPSTTSTSTTSRPTRRTTRSSEKILAWGHALPDVRETEFALPKDMLEDENLKEIRLTRSQSHNKKRRAEQKEENNDSDAVGASKRRRRS